MKKEYFTASRTIVIALACVTAMSLTACGGDDEPEINEPEINKPEINKPESDKPESEDILSDKTTPVTFLLESGISYMFDYAGERYLASDTIEGYSGKLVNGVPVPIEVEIDLRQGKHNLLWLSGLNRTDQKSDGVHFDPEKKVVFTKGDDPMRGVNVRYAISEVSVAEYLLPNQKLDYMSLTAKIKISIYDNCIIGKPEGIMGVIKGFPNFTSVSLFDNNYTLDDNQIANPPLENPYRQKYVESTSPNETYIRTYYYDSSKMETYYRPYVQEPDRILCPLNGFDNIQLMAEVFDEYGNTIPTTELPKISIKRGCTTYMYGPLFSGSASDWTVFVLPDE